MTKRTRRLLSLILASAMVFTMNTSVFAEEVAVEENGGVEEEAVDTPAEEVSYEAAVDSDAEVTGSAGDHFEGNVLRDSKGNIKTTITYAADPKENKDKSENLATIKGVDSCVSWGNALISANGYNYDQDATEDVDHYYGADLIYTVLKGKGGEAENLLNDEKVTVSADRSEGGDDEFSLKLRKSKFAHYEVLDLGDKSHYIFVGYGSTDNSSDIESALGYSEAANVDKYEGVLPVYEYDTRRIVYNKSGYHKASKGEAQRLDVEIALVEYANNTVTELPGLKIGGVKIDTKTIRNASVSGQPITEKWKYKKLKADKTGTEEAEGKRSVYPRLTGTDLPFFTITASIKAVSKAAEYKKAIKNALKNKKFYFAIRQKVVDTIINNSNLLFEDEGYSKSKEERIKNMMKNEGIDREEAETMYQIMHLLESNSQEDAESYRNTPSKNSVLNNADKFFEATVDRKEYNFSPDTSALTYFKIAKFDQKKGKANLSFTVPVYDGKTVKYESNSLKVKRDYELIDGTVGNEPVKVLKFVGNFIYRDSSAVSNPQAKKYALQSGYLAPFGYKYAFRQSPTDKDCFREGVFKDNNDGFVYSVE